MKVVGLTTTYVGHTIPGYHGKRVRILAVMRAGTDPDGDEHYVTSDATLARLGGVTKHDRVDVAELRANGTLSFVSFVSFVSCDPLATELECFASLSDSVEDKLELVPTEPARPHTTDAIFATIARKHLRIMTLQVRHRGSLDFHVVSVWAVLDALEAAYRAGIDATGADR
jgi:hypothetical protein